MKDVGATKNEDYQNREAGTLVLSQAENINKVLSRFNMQNAKQ